MTTCPSGKIGYATSAAARRFIALRVNPQARYTHKKKGRASQVYRCDSCRNWHITSLKDRKRQRMREFGGTIYGMGEYA